MYYDVIHVESEHKSFSWANGLYIVIKIEDDTINMCALDEKGQPHLFDDGRFMITCTGVNNTGITKTNLKYNYAS
ncbi:MAG: hypothetical protein WC428_02360 [Candidatus Paceibacterota bacterium]